jgi:DNA-binding beta-propeller fold protein YncE
MKFRKSLMMAAVAVLASRGLAQEKQFKVLNNVKLGGTGGMDYVTADSENRRLYIPRGDHVMVVDLDTLKSVGDIPGTTGVHGVAIDPGSNHGFTSNGSGHSVVMFDTKTLKVLDTITVKGSPDGIFFEPHKKYIYSLSHAAPNVTVLNGADGKVVGEIDLGGQPEGGASDGKGHAYINLEDKGEVAVVDTDKLTTTAHWTTGDPKAASAGLVYDPETNRIFSCGHNLKMAVLDAKDGSIVGNVPIAAGNDAADFDPSTREIFASNGGGTGVLTVVKINSPSSFVVEQDVPTKANAKTCAVDTKTHHVLLVTFDYITPEATPAAPAMGGRAPEGGAAGQPAPAARAGGRGGRRQPVPDSFQVIVVGKE